MTINEDIYKIFSSCEAVALSGNRPEICTAATLYLVSSGEADLFYIRENGDLLPINSFMEGQLFLAVGQMQISGREGSSVRPVALSELGNTGDKLDLIISPVAHFFDSFVYDFLHAAPGGRSFDGNVVDLEEGEVLRAGSTPEVISVSRDCLFCGDYEISGGSVWLLAKSSWLVSDSGITCRRVEADNETVINVLKNICGFLTRTMFTFSSSQDEKWVDEIRSRKENSLGSFSSTLRDMATIMESEIVAEGSGDAVDFACMMVAKKSGIHLNERKQVNSKSVEEFASRQSIRCRTVRIDNEWYNSDCGPLVGVYDGAVVALINKDDHYLLYQAGQPACRVDSAIAEKIDDFAWSFFEGLPQKKVRRRDIISLSWRGGGSDLYWIMMLGLVTGLLGMVTPAMTGLVIGDIIPAGEYSMLFELGLGLLAATVAGSLFSMVENFAMMRFTSRSSFRLQAAIWDRLLSLPASFFGKYDAGDLASRAMGIQAVREIIGQQLLSSSLAIVVGAFNVIVALVYSWQLTLVTIAFSLVGCLVGLALSFYQLKYQRKIQKISGDLSGFVLQLITGIAKVRISGSEVRAFSFWSRLFVRQKKSNFTYSIFSQISGMIFSALPLVQTGVVFYIIVSMNADERISTGAYMAFSAAAAQISAALSSMFSLVMSIVQALPQYERAQPILDTPVEHQPFLNQAPILQGRVELRNIEFSYSSGAKVLSGVSISAEPGEFIAVVGSSGAGKSTLLKIMLGVQKQSAGSVVFDDAEISSFDLKSLRKQFGVVLQNGGIMQGSIYSNVCGATNITIDQAWDALDMAGLAEEVSVMPMGIHTVLPQGGGVLSGGQRQRLVIARALASNPRILFFDEATSALDNRLQAEVSENIERLNLTRIVIAHRLSTIMNADRIYVLDKGRVVQEGSYNQLLEEDGIFADLCRRQMA